MSIRRQLTRGLRTLLHRSAVDAEIADEVRDYYQHTVAAHVARGLSSDAARRAARAEVGNATMVREQVAGYGWENVVDIFLSDLRYALRRLRNTPAFAIIAILTLAVGIGASTAIFSAVNPILFEPLPYPNARRLVTIWDQGGDGAQLAVTHGNYRELAARARAFDSLAVVGDWAMTLGEGERAERLDGLMVSPSYFHTVGVLPAFGRDFDRSDDRPGAARTAILSDRLWRRRFAGDSAIIGRRIALDGIQFTVVGVMPRGFESVGGPSTDVWTPLRYPPSPPSEGPEWGHNLRMFGRLAAGVSMDQATRELAAIAGNAVPEFARPPWAAMRRGLVVSPLRNDMTRGVRPALVAVVGAVLLLLLIACVNVTNLLLARGAQRRGELAMRAALGAGRTRLVAQLLTESVVLAVPGGVMGVGVAAVGVRALVTLAPPALPRLSAIGVNGATLAFALAISTIIGVAIGLVPAMQLSRRNLHSGVQHASRRSSGHQATRRGLVVAEIALALVLLVSAGLLVRSIQRLFAVDPGFAPANVLTMRIETSGRRFADDSVTLRFFAQALDAVRRVPGVKAAAYTSQLPLSGDGDLYGAHFESSPTGRNESSVFRYAVSPGYFATMGMSLVHGRVLDSTDRAGAPPAVVLNESFARRKFPAGNAIGQHLHLGPDRGPWFTIVGVVRDVKQLSLAAPQADAVYMPTEQGWFVDAVLSLVVRTRGDAASLAPAVQAAVWSADRSPVIVRVATMDNVVAASAAERRFTLVVFEVFAGAALLLAAIGIYGVISGSVTERMREIGIRSALGASPTEILSLVLRQGMLVALVGVCVGLVGAIAASRTLVTLLFDVSSLDVTTYAAVTALLVGVSGIACWIPATRAARVDPTVTLRAD